MHFKDLNNKLYFLDDASFAHLLPSDCVEITDEEAEILRQPAPLSVAERKAIKQREIDTLEAGQFMTRGEREGWIAMVLAQATAQSVPEPTLYLANSFYKKLKDVNTQVTLLRAALKAIV
jgi:hypothetical protein